ncbi:hypothetical protein MRB53_038606 [Persea americana]|nr:hypothetical protein MRB53_038606 [Persea americana]
MFMPSGFPKKPKKAECTEAVGVTERDDERYPMSCEVGYAKNYLWESKRTILPVDNLFWKQRGNVGATWEERAFEPKLPRFDPDGSIHEWTEREIYDDRVDVAPEEIFMTAEEREEAEKQALLDREVTEQLALLPTRSVRARIRRSETWNTFDKPPTLTRITSWMGRKPAGSTNASVDSGYASNTLSGAHSPVESTVSTSPDFTSSAHSSPASSTKSAKSGLHRIPTAISEKRHGLGMLRTTTATVLDVRTSPPKSPRMRRGETTKVIEGLSVRPINPSDRAMTVPIKDGSAEKKRNSPIKTFFLKEQATLS